MVRTCVYCGKTKKENSDKGRTFHKFPLKDAEYLDRWLNNMDRGSSFVLPKNALLCSDHFEQTCFQKDTTKGCLMPGSIPTVFREYKSVCVFCHAVRGPNKERIFHKFPLGDAELLQKWIAAMNVKDFVANKKSLLCSDHFEKGCFRKRNSQPNNVRLKENAVPTVFTLPQTKEAPATKQAELPVFPMEKCVSFEAPIPNSTSDVHTFPNLKLSTPHEGRRKDVSSENLLPSKIQKIDNTSDITDHSVRENANDSDERHCHEDELLRANSLIRAETPALSKTTVTSNIARHIIHDHQYETTPRSMKNKIVLQNRKIQALMKERHSNRKHISRLKKQVTSLKTIVSELRKTRALPASGLKCLYRSNC